MPRMTFTQAVERLKELVDRDSTTAWEMGDIALVMVPMNPDHAHNGADDKVRVLADAAGIGFDVLRQRRLVSHQFAQVTRVTSVSWSVYREIGNLSDPDERARLIEMLRTEKADTPSGRWTVSAVRVRMGGPPILHVSEPVAEHVQRATTEERAAIYTSLRDDPKVVEVAEEREADLVKDTEARTERLRQSDPIIQQLDAGQALLDLERAMRVFVREVASIFPRITGLPDPEADKFRRAVALRQFLARTYGAADQIKSLLDTGRPDGDVDTFLREVLSAEGGKQGT